MRARDNKHRAEELAAVVRWLRARADALDATGAALAGLRTPEAVALLRECGAKVLAFRDAADALERGEHHVA